MHTTGDLLVIAKLDHSHQSRTCVTDPETDGHANYRLLFDCRALLDQELKGELAESGASIAASGSKTTSGALGSSPGQTPEDLLLNS